METLEKIIQWQKDRNLDKMPYSHYYETLNSLEEICETWGLDRDFAEGLCDIIAANGNIQDDKIIIDGIFDDSVYNIGKIMKLGYNPIIVFDEGLKEINERTGAYDAQVGKWVKNKPKENPYRANYSKAKYGN